MRAILYSNYKTVEDYINKLQEQNQNEQLTSIDDEVILEQKQKLQEIYNNYKRTFEMLLNTVKQFEEQKRHIKKLLSIQRRALTTPVKKLQHNK
jgi:DNA-binding NtrC family response regulator